MYIHFVIDLKIDVTRRVTVSTDQLVLASSKSDVVVQVEEI